MRIRIFVNEEPFVIELCEGDAEIRREASAKSTADRRCTTYPFSGSPTPELARASVSLRVEAV